MIVTCQSLCCEFSCLSLFPLQVQAVLPTGKRSKLPNTAFLVSAQDLPHRLPLSDLESAQGKKKKACVTFDSTWTATSLTHVMIFKTFLGKTNWLKINQKIEMNLLLPLKGNVGDKRAFLEKEEDRIWEVNGLILLEAVPQVISAEIRNLHHIVGEWSWGGHWLMPMSIDSTSRKARDLGTIDLAWKDDLRSSDSSMGKLWPRELMEVRQ